MTASKDFRDALAETAVEFVSLISSEANDISEKENKKTIGAEHVIAALKELGFDNYIGPVQDAAEEHKRSMAVSCVAMSIGGCRCADQPHRQGRKSRARHNRVV